MVRLYSWYPLDASAIKALVLDRTGQPINRRARIETPSPCTPAAVMEAIRRLAKRQDKFDRVAVGFPGVVRSGIIETAVNLHKKWRGFDLARKLQSQLKRPVRVVNDADLQGLGAVSGTPFISGKVPKNRFAIIPAAPTSKEASQQSRSRSDGQIPRSK